MAAAASPDALQAFNVDFSEISLGEKVGHGSFGVVSKAMWRNQLVAVKEFFASAEQKDIEKEVKQLSRVKHPNIIALHGISLAQHGISVAQQATYLIMEYAEGGSLHNFLHGKVKPAYSLAHAMSWALQCAEGVAYLHGMTPKPLIHRDLKPLNLLLTNKGRNLKICDFGTVADKSTMMTNNRGSAAWMAPEVFEGSKYTEKCDIFSWAIVLWEVLSRKPPFMDIDNAYTIQWKIHKGERPPLLDNCPKHIEQLMTACWMTAPEDRPSMRYIVSVMNEIIKDYVGADKPLEYTFINQQIVTKESDGTVAAQYDSLSHSSSDMSLASTQLTPTNVRVGGTAQVDTETGNECTEYTSSEITPTNSGQLDNNGLFHMSSSNRWDAIPEEDSCESQNDSFNLTSSVEANKRLETIRNGMIQMASRPMQQLTLDVDANDFEPNRSESSRSSNSLHAKTDGRERLTVTDTKPMIVTSGGSSSNTNTNTNNTDLTTNNNNNNNSNSNNNNNNNYNFNSNNNEFNTNGLLSHALNANNEPPNDCLDATIDEHADDNDADDDDDADVDAGCGCTEQSLAEILDPELQPEPPIPNNSESQAIYRDHRHMAKEYLSVDTNLYYAQDFKEKLILQMDRIERDQKQELLRKIKDKEGLQSLYNNLQQQWEKLPAARQANLHGRLQPPLPVGSNSHHSSSQELTGGITRSDSVENDGWVVIAPHHNT